MATDPRFARSATALREAVLALAAERPVERISVTELAQAAGVTRATFYNHATSPQALLAAALRVELDEIRATFLDRVSATADLREVWSTSGLDLLDHIRRHGGVYRTGLSPTPDSDGTVLTDLLVRHIEATLAIYLDRLGAPEPSPGPAATRRAMESSFLAHGIVGAYRAWLSADAPIDGLDAVDVIFQSTPAWWWDLAPAAP